MREMEGGREERRGGGGRERWEKKRGRMKKVHLALLRMFLYIFSTFTQILIFITIVTLKSDGSLS